MYFKKLYNGIIDNEKIAEMVILEIDMQSEVWRNDGLEDTPNYEDLQMIRGDLMNMPEYPYQLKLHTTAEDLYKHNIIENIEDNALRNWMESLQ